MKLTILLCALLFSTAIFAQNSVSHLQKRNRHVPDSSVSSPSLYVAVGISMGNGEEIKSSSYPSLEFGVVRKNLSLGVAVGTSSFETGSLVFYEPKISVNAPIGPVRGFIMFGAGSYFNTSRTFIEYGSGILFKAGAGDLSLQLSNFDRNDYLSVGYSFSF